MSLLAFALVGLAVVLLAGAGFAIALARQSKKQYEAQGQLIPGQASEAPAEWAGAHTPEARMHRRLGQVVRSLRTLSNQPGEDVRMLDMRVELEQHALAVDRQLIAASALPPGVREPALAKAEQAVAAVEQAGAQLATMVTSAADNRALEELTERIRIAAEVRAELDTLGATDQPTSRPQPDTPRRGAEEEQGGTAMGGTA